MLYRDWYYCAAILVEVSKKMQRQNFFRSLWQKAESFGSYAKPCHQRYVIQEIHLIRIVKSRGV
jgi:hypothetical protein